MRDRPPLRLVLVVLAVLVALGHVCALPLHAEPRHEPVAPHPTTGHHGDDASCEAASPAPFSTVVTMALAAVPAELGLPAPASAALEVRPALSRSSPRFLLFLTLRI